MTELPASLRLPRKPAGTAPAGLGVTRRVDNWWIAPGVQGVLFTVCALYLFVSGILLTPLTGMPYEVDGYLSPLFSPLIAPDWLPTWFSPGIFILWIPLGFRATCYYYRKAYYRFYFADPPGCAVGEPPIHRRYAMETVLPFILQNAHRFFLYLAFVPLFFLWVDAAQSLRFEGQWRIGLGVFVLFFNAALLSGYSLSCHSLRHLIGGRMDCFSCTRRAQVRHGMWQRLTSINRHHMAWAWASLISVTLADVYVRLLATGVIIDPAIHF
ncbi:MAG: succinate dehydrogenase [Chloroflexota bacterium]